MFCYNFYWKNERIKCKKKISFFQIFGGLHVLKNSFFPLNCSIFVVKNRCVSYNLLCKIRSPDSIRNIQEYSSKTFPPEIQKYPKIISPVFII